MSCPPHPPDIVVKFHLTARTAEGSARVVRSGYRPIYGIRPDYWSSAHHEFVNAEVAKTDEPCEAEVWLLAPEAHPHTMWIGRTIQVAEGPRIVGVAEVQQILNPLLERPAPKA
ncbi:hypothetical protein LMG19083_03728 [Ralstonia psammae]|uniref:Uncharacterized protein n=1 Tax=Ralstonia psammae TaxID=3058598 RepID=A0ABN9J5S3_9RALS|nr:hypothetical protein LMG19083_03728 [Ralstonia sp. LMG 19083]